MGVLGGKGRVGLYVDEVAAELEVGDEGAVLGEAGEGNAVGDVWVHGGQGVGVGAAEAVADVDNLLELVVYALEAAFTQLLGEGTEGIDLEEGLDFLNRVAVGRHGDSEAVPREGREAVLVGGHGAVGVVARVERHVPVAPVEADTVSEYLQGLRLLAPALARCAVGCRELVVAADGLVLLEDLRSVIGSLLGVVQDEVCDFNVVLGCLEVEDTISGRELDGDGNVVTGHG